MLTRCHKAALRELPQSVKGNSSRGWLPYTMWANFVDPFRLRLYHGRFTREAFCETIRVLIDHGARLFGTLGWGYSGPPLDCHCHDMFRRCAQGLPALPQPDRYRSLFFIDTWECSYSFTARPVECIKSWRFYWRSWNVARVVKTSWSLCCSTWEMFAG